MYWTYILYNTLYDKFYIGSTGELDVRFARHNAGGSNATRYGAGFWELAYFEKFETKSEAYQRELYIKKQKSRKYLEKLILGY